MKEEEEWNTGAGMRKWQECFDCGQQFHGAVKLALGGACWKTYLGRPDTDMVRCMGIGVLGDALRASSRAEEALPVLEAGLALGRRHWPHGEQAILVVQNNIAICLSGLARYDEALALRRNLYARFAAILGVSDEKTIVSGSNLATSLIHLELWDEAKTILRDQLLPMARQSLGRDHETCLALGHRMAEALVGHPNANDEDRTQAEMILQDVVQRRRRVLGPAHPRTQTSQLALSELHEIVKWHKTRR